MHDWIPTREALTAVTMCKSGFIAAVGPTQSAVIYTYGNAGFQIVCADPVSRGPVACLPLHKDLVEVEQVCFWTISVKKPLAQDILGCARFMCSQL